MSKQSLSSRLSKGQIVGIVLLAISIAVLLFSIFNFLPILNKFFLGTFGAVLYPAMAFLILISIALLMKKHFVYSIKYVLYLIGAFVCILAIIHTIVTAKWAGLNYGDYLVNCYDFKYTPGGLILGIITFPIMSLLNSVAGCVFYAIALAIFVALIIDYLYAVKQFAKLNAPIVVDTQSEPVIDTLPQPIEVETESSAFDFSALQKNEYSQKTNEPLQQNQDNILVKKKLGLIKDDPSDIIIPSRKDKTRNLTPSEQLFGAKEEVKQEWLNKTISMPKQEPKQVPKQDDKNVKLREFLQATGYQSNNNIDPIITNTNISTQTPSQEIEDLPKIENAGDNSQYKPKKLVEENINNQRYISPDMGKSLIQPKTNNNNFTSRMEENEKDKVLGQQSKVESSLNKNYGIGPSKPKNNFEQIQMIGAEKNKKPLPPIMAKALNYKRPPVELLNKVEVDYQEFATEQAEKSAVIEKTLDNFKIPVQVQAVRRGAAVTRYELKMPTGIPVKKINNHCEDIELALASKGSIRIETPIRGKSAVGIEVPNDKIDMVTLRDIVESKEFNANQSPLAFALGKDVDGKVFTCNLAKMPHLLVAGATNSGKSVCLNALLISLIYRTAPEDLRLILIDPKRVEFTSYNDLPHLILPKVITEPQKAINAFDWLINEMERRYGVFEENCVVNISGYNSLPGVVNGTMVKMGYIVMVVDELADLMASGNKKELENKIVRLVQKARAAGIHIVLATQRPSVDVITGTIKANLPSRIAFAVTNYIDSKTILDQGGAEKLLGRGDMLYSPSDSEPTRVQGAYVSNEEVQAVVEYIKANNSTIYDESIANAINKEGTDGVSAGSAGGASQDLDPLFVDCLRLVVETGQVSISMLQRRFSLGFSRAARIVDQMELAKFISPSEGGKPRNVYMTKEEFESAYGGQD